MNITLTRDQEAFIRGAIETGRFDRMEDAVTEARLLWKDREASRATFLATLDEAEAALDRGEGVEIATESMTTLAADIGPAGRARLTAERRSPG